MTEPSYRDRDLLAENQALRAELDELKKKHLAVVMNDQGAPGLPCVSCRHCHVTDRVHIWCSGPPADSVRDAVTHLGAVSCGRYRERYRTCVHHETVSWWRRLWNEWRLNVSPT